MFIDDTLWSTPPTEGDHQPTRGLLDPELLVADNDSALLEQLSATDESAEESLTDEDRNGSPWVDAEIFDNTRD